jgi:hypothetical protein
MKETFRAWNPDEKSRVLVEACCVVLVELRRYRLTLRQLYYQLVTRNIIPNAERSYQNLSRVVTRARMAGLIDWDAIEDRARLPRAASEWNNLAELVDGALYSYRLPRWSTQNTYCELWVEKDALASVLWPIAYRHHVTLMVNRGYSSASAMYGAAQRFKYRGDGWKHLVILYLGDFDPSGEDMVRDVRERLEEFGVDVEVQKVALNWDQIQQYNPPPNPAKLTDPRAKEFVRKHGGSSWEVDALPPAVLTELINAAMDSVIDYPTMQVIIDREEQDKIRLQDAVKAIQDER